MTAFRNLSTAKPTPALDIQRSLVYSKLHGQQKKHERYFVEYVYNWQDGGANLTKVHTHHGQTIGTKNRPKKAYHKIALLCFNVLH